MVTLNIGRRGQMVLIGAVIIAAVIIGLSVLVNTVLFTESVGSDSVNSRVESTTVTDFEIRKGVRSLLLRVNHATRNVTVSSLNDHASENVTGYSRLLAESRAIAKPTGLEVAFHESGTTEGIRIVQSHDDELSGPTDNPNWRPYDAGGSQRVGWFTMNVQIRNTTQNPFHITAEADDSSEELNLSFIKTGNGTLRINSNASFEDSTTVCDPSSGRVLLDVYEGESFSDDCSFVGTNVWSGLAGVDTYDLRFVRGDQLTGKYSLVLNESSAVTGIPPCDGLSPADADPCHAPVIWSANVSMDVTGEGLEYANQYDITVYSQSR